MDLIIQNAYCWANRNMISNLLWLISILINKYSQEFHYYPFVVKLERCVGSCKTINDLSNKVCVPNKTEDLNLSVLIRFTETN